MTTKSDLTGHVAAVHNLTARQAREIIDTVLVFIADEVHAGGKVTLKGFGSFAMRDSAARMGRNPQTGEATPIPASSRMVFRAAKKAGA